MTHPAEGDEVGIPTREALVAACETAFRAWKRATEGTPDWTTSYVAYMDAAHALNRYDMPHLAAMAPVWRNVPEERERRPDDAEETEYPIGECPF